MKQSTFRLFNHHYEIDFEEVLNFDWNFQMGPVSYKGYETLDSGLPAIIESLNRDPNTRQAILTLNNKSYMSCLINIQWLVHESTLYCITNFRSQHKEWGRPQDSKLILFLTTQVKAQLENIDKVQIEVNVADYHSYLI
jgi:thymidylate synthase